MMYINEIATLLNIDTTTASEVFDHMCIDFSESTQKEFNDEAKSVFAELQS